LDKKLGIYICSGCEIGKCLNVEQLSQNASTADLATCKTHRALCSVEGYELIKEDIEIEKLSGIVIAACSPREKTEVFNFPFSIQLERVNIRELVAWIGEPGQEDMQMAAEDYVKMGITKLKTTSIPESYIEDEICNDILVVGGGVSGLTAAIEGAKAGYTVYLIEKESDLGGWANILYKQIPFKPPYDQLKEPLVTELIAEAEKDERIHIFKSTAILQIDGHPGRFEVTLKNMQTEKIVIGAIVAALGWKPYNAQKLSHLGYGRSDKVFTNLEFETLIKRNPKQKLPGTILFIQCAGSRDKDHLPYCSSYCCSTSLKQAKYIRESNPDSLVYIVYKDIRTPGMYEEFYKEVQRDDQVFFTKGDVEKVETQNEKLKVIIRNTLLGDDISIMADLIILATGMTPSTTADLNLNYRLGKGLPELKYEFPDSHFICFPYETRRTGIYAAGTLRAPMDIAACIEDAEGAMLKAIQCIEATKRGEAMHPRAGDKSYPELFMDRCTDCKRCTEECPFGMFDETEKGTPLPNPARCRRCGICLGSCPERVINFADFSINSVSAMIKSVSMPDEFEEKPRVLAFVCENDAYPALEMAARKGLKWSSFIRIIPVRCIGSINKVWISDALSCGYDGILQIGCKPGDDYQCHYIHGSELTQKRGENLQETLQTMMLEPERIKTVFVEITDYHKIPVIFEEYMNEIEAIGPNPFKSM